MCDTISVVDRSARTLYLFITVKNQSLLACKNRILRSFENIGYCVNVHFGFAATHFDVRLRCLLSLFCQIQVKISEKSLTSESVSPFGLLSVKGGCN